MSARADIEQGLQMVAYQIDAIPPVRSDDVYVQCGSESVEFINRNFDAQPIDGCATDLFMVHLTGYLTIPEHETIEMMYATDDGGYIEIGQYGFGDWVDRGCSWSVWTGGDIPAATYPVSAWQYENGGAACMMLAWKIDDQQWSIVPPDAFTMAATPPTTTTTTTTTSTTSTTSTTLPASTTSTVPVTTSSTTATTTSTVPVQTTEATQTTSTSTSTTTSTTTTTTTVPPMTPPMTTSTVPEPPATTTTTTTVPETTTTEPPTTTTEPPTTTTEPPTTTTDETVPDTTAPDNPIDETTTTLSKPVIQTTLPDSVPETTVPEPDDVISAADVAALAAAVIEIASASPKTVTVEQITAVIESAAFEMITDEQLAEIADVISDADDGVKDVFESAVNIYESEALGGYVPKGSTISVAERRVVTGVVVISFVLPAPMPVTSSGSASRRKRLH